MIDIYAETTIPIDLDSLWRLLNLHIDEATLRSIHPWILQGTAPEDDGQVAYQGLSFPERRMVSRTIRPRKRSIGTTWEYSIYPPEEFNYGIRGPDGFEISVDNAYAKRSGGTMVRTTVLGYVPRVPSFIASSTLWRFLKRADREDFAFLERLGLRPKGK